MDNKKELSERAIESRRKNVEKARLTRKMKQEEQRQIVDKYRKELEERDEESDESSSEDEVITYNEPKRKTKKTPNNNEYETRIKELEYKITALSKSKSKPKEKKIYIETQGPEKIVEKIVEKQVLQKNQMIDHMRKKIINF